MIHTPDCAMYKP